MESKDNEKLLEPQVEDYSSRIAKIKGEAGVIW